MISFSCPKCRLYINVPEEMSGSQIACRKCGQRIRVPVPGFMTGFEWLSDDPRMMLDALYDPAAYVEGGVSQRKLRLFACACCRQMWKLLTDRPSQRAVEVAECFADGKATNEKLEAALNDAGAAREAAKEAADKAAKEADEAAREAREATRKAEHDAYEAARKTAGKAGEAAIQAEKARCDAYKASLKSGNAADKALHNAAVKAAREAREAASKAWHDAYEAARKTAGKAGEAASQAEKAARKAYEAAGKAEKAYAFACRAASADAWAAALEAASAGAGWFSGLPGWGGRRRTLWVINGATQAALLRDIFANPCRPVAVEQNWLTSGVAELSRTIYDGRRFTDMPKLADALEEAGCTNEDMLTHCREGRVHVRGCWVVDLLLGNT